MTAICGTHNYQHGGHDAAAAASLWWWFDAAGVLAGVPI